MKTSHAIFAIALTAASFGGATFAAPSANAGTATMAQTENWLTIPAIYDKVTAAGYIDITEIERERDGYEIKATGPDGKRVKLYVDPMNGEVLDSRAKKDKSDKYRSDRTDSRGQDTDRRGDDARF